MGTVVSTSIEWTATVHPDGRVTPGSTWNPVTGCSKVSPGCAHCYAERVAIRLWPSQYPHVDSNTRQPIPAGVWVHPSEPRRFTDVQCHEDRLDQPLRWKKPRKVFVNSMSHLFHEDVPDAFIDRVFAVMALAPQQTFQILTKRAARMHRYITRQGDDPVLSSREQVVNGAIWERLGTRRGSKIEHGGNWRCRWPLPNVWLGVSVENQHFADERIPLLLQTPAAIRFISAEPLLEAIDLRRWLYPARCISTGRPMRPMPERDLFGLDWVIVGGESGPGARPCYVDWIRAIKAQCRAASVPLFVKQLGAEPRAQEGVDFRDGDLFAGRPTREILTVPAMPNGVFRFRDRKGGDMAEWPDDLRVREFPLAVNAGQRPS